MSFDLFPWVIFLNEGLWENESLSKSPNRDLDNTSRRKEERRRRLNSHVNHMLKVAKPRPQACGKFPQIIHARRNASRENGEEGSFWSRPKSAVQRTALDELRHNHLGRPPFGLLARVSDLPGRPS